MVPAGPEPNWYDKQTRSLRSRPEPHARRDEALPPVADCSRRDTWGRDTSSPPPRPVPQVSAAGLSDPSRVRPTCRSYSERCKRLDRRGDTSGGVHATSHTHSTAIRARAHVLAASGSLTRGFLTEEPMSANAHTVPLLAQLNAELVHALGAHYESERVIPAVLKALRGAR